MKNFFANALKNLRGFLISNQAHEIEQAVIHASAPVIEAGILVASKANPIASVVVTTVVLPAIQAEVAHLEQPPTQAAS
jgi:hypothetical protein